MEIEELKQIEARIAEAKRVDRLREQMTKALEKFDGCMAFTVKLSGSPQSWVDVLMADDDRPTSVCFANDHPELKGAIRLAVREVLVKRLDELTDQFAKV